MKSCPMCNRTFEDTFTFCLVDGSILSAPFDPNVTQKSPNARDTSPPPTEVMLPSNYPDRDALLPTMPSPKPVYVPPPINNSAPYSQKPQLSQRQYTPQKKRAAIPWPLPIVPVLLWLIGLSAHMGGGLIHLLLFVTLIFCVINLATDRD